MYRSVFKSVDVIGAIPIHLVFRSPLPKPHFHTVASPNLLLSLSPEPIKELVSKLLRNLLKNNLGSIIFMGNRNVEHGQAPAAQFQAESLPVEAITIDITSDESITAAVKEVESKFGRLDVLIKNAGVALDIKFKGASGYRELMQTTYNTNVFGKPQDESGE